MPYKIGEIIGDAELHVDKAVEVNEACLADSFLHRLVRFRDLSINRQRQHKCSDFVCFKVARVVKQDRASVMKTGAILRHGAHRDSELRSKRVHCLDVDGAVDFRAVGRGLAVSECVFILHVVPETHELSFLLFGCRAIE